MSLILLVEGRSDRGTIPILVRKLGYPDRVNAQVVKRGDMLNFDRIQSTVSDVIRRRRDVDLILICIDADESQPRQLLDRTRPIENRLNRDSAIPIRYAIVDHALEGWLACDEDALRSVLGGGRATINIRGNPDSHLDPASTLSRVFSDNRRDFRKTRDNPRIAQATTPQNIAVKSPTFQRFAQLLGHPLTT